MEVVTFTHCLASLFITMNKNNIKSRLFMIDIFPTFSLQTNKSNVNCKLRSISLKVLMILCTYRTICMLYVMYIQYILFVSNEAHHFISFNTHLWIAFSKLLKRSKINGLIHFVR